jgi:hypothetical protein
MEIVLGLWACFGVEGQLKKDRMFNLAVADKFGKQRQV